jgi:8-oxo-dGTP diphosphatase
VASRGSAEATPPRACSFCLPPIAYRLPPNEGGVVTSTVQRAAGVLLIDERGWILLQLRDANGAYPHHWGTVGGKVESGETSEEAARRELAEETGYAAGPLRFGAEVTLTLPEGTPRVATLFYARYDGVQPIACLEGARIEFVDPDTLDDLPIYPGQETLIRATLAIENLRRGLRA